MEPWTLLDERPGSSGYLRITSRRYRMPDGTELWWDIVGGNRSVAVLALTADEQVVLARQFRPGPGRVLDELPGGRVEDGESVEAGAARELLEETGYAGSLEVVASDWLSASARTRRFVAVALDAERVGDPEPDPGEHIETVLRPLPAFRAQLRRGELTDVDLGYLALDYLGRLSG
jgi:ADP-ribose pyrophosphatase